MKNTTLIYIEKDGKTLMLHRTKKKNDLNSDLWIGVGGHCEEDESPEECAVREAKEETGLTLTDYDYRGIVTFVSDKYEGDLEWIYSDLVPTLPTWRGDRIFLGLLRENAPFFSLKLVYRGADLVRAVLNGKELEV